MYLKIYRFAILSARKGKQKYQLFVKIWNKSDISFSIIKSVLSMVYVPFKVCALGSKISSYPCYYVLCIYHCTVIVILFSLQVNYNN